MRYAFALMILCLLLTGCGRRDAKLQQQVTGTWMVDMGNNLKSVNLITPDGRFAARVTGFTNGSVVSIEGTFHVKDGALIETVTKSSQTNEKVPFVVRGQILRIDAHEMVVKWDTKPYNVVVVARRIPMKAGAKKPN